MDKNHIARPQSEKLGSAESPLVVNLHKRSVFARFLLVKPDRFTIGRTS